MSSLAKNIRILIGHSTYFESGTTRGAERCRSFVTIKEKRIE